MARITRRLVLAGGAALGAVSPTAGAAPTASPDINAAVSEALQAHGSPGVSLAVCHKGEVILARGYGFANLETQSAVTERTIFRVGSLTKQFTAAAVIKLASQGRLDLKAPVASYLPAFSKLPSLNLMELMNHTAGLHSDESAGDSPAPAGPKTQVQLAEEIAGQAKPFDFDPGTAWLYSNANYIVLGAVIENATAKPLAHAMKELIFMPLGLPTLAFDSSDEVVLDRASGYTPTDSPSAPFANAAYIEVADAGGAGAMRADAVDLCRWHQALLGTKLFDQSHLDIMLQPGRLRDGRVSGANRFSADDAHYGDVQYACGLLVSGPSDPHPNILHYGFINGFASALQTYREPLLTFAALCNSDTNPGLPFRGIRKALVNQYLAAGR